MANFIIIRDLCERKKITIRELASRIGKDESTIQTLMRNGSTNTTTLEKIAQVLNVPISYFFEETSLGGNITQKGKGNFIANSQQVTISDCESKLEIAQNKIESLEALLEEKERTIQILMNK